MANENKKDEIICEIPSHLPTLACIEYPGNVQNIDNALETLGGIDKIKSTLDQYQKFKDDESKKTKEPFLELNFNPNGMFDHPLFGKIKSGKNCLLIKKTTKKRKLSEITPSDDEQITSSKLEVIGKISSVVSFDGLADFQVFPEAKYPKTTNGQKKDRLWSLDNDAMYPMVPSVFAAKDQSYKHMLERPKKRKITKQTNNLETKPTEIRFIKKEVPKQAKKKSIWRKYDEKLKEYVNDRNKAKEYSFCERIRNEIILQIKSYFKQRAIWSQNEILLQKILYFMASYQALFGSNGQ